MMAERKPELCKQYLTRHTQLKTERASWFSHWGEITTFILPRSGRYFTQDRNRGHKRHNHIYDNTATRSLRILAAGMMSGMTSPARPWFRLTTPDPYLAQHHAVKIWLSEVTSLLHRIFQKSNTYRALHTMYEELGGFGTSASIVVPDFNNIIHHHPLTTGEYCIATDWQGKVCTLYREFEKTVGEIVKEFGIDAVSTHVKAMYDRGALDQWVLITHVIEPRDDRDIGKLDAKSMPWKSIYFETGHHNGKVLRESGFKRFPALVPRWAVAGGDIYGNSPGMEALGDIKQLQQEQLRKSQAIDYQSNPPLQVPTSMKELDVNRMPGGINYVDGMGGQPPIRSAFEVNLNLNDLLIDIQDVRERVRGSFYADLFLMLSRQQDTRMTATEVAERHEEKLLMLGPVLERLQSELLEPLIEMTFDAAQQAGIVPPPPPELNGMALNVELVSMLAQAQRAIGTNSIDRFVGNLGAVAQYKPDVLDKFDADKWVEVYSDSLGVDPTIVIPADQVAAIRQARAKQAQQAQQAQALNTAADTTNKLANAPTTGDSNALNDITRAFSGYV